MLCAMVSGPYVVTAALHGAVNGLPRLGARRSITVDQQAGSLCRLSTVNTTTTH